MFFIILANANQSHNFIPETHSITINFKIENTKGYEGIGTFVYYWWECKIG
jgi:hypothetical protein